MLIVTFISSSITCIYKLNLFQLRLLTYSLSHSLTLTLPPSLIQTKNICNSLPRWSFIRMLVLLNTEPLQLSAGTTFNFQKHKTYWSLQDSYMKGMGRGGWWWFCILKVLAISSVCQILFLEFVNNFAKIKAFGRQVSMFSYWKVG